MASFLSLLTLVSLLPSILANPLPAPEPEPAHENVLGKRHFTIKQQSRQRRTSWIAPVAVRRTYWKYGLALPAGLHSIAEKAIADAFNGTGSVAAIPEENDIEYLSPVTVGGKTLMLDFDTGSADLWCFSSQLPTAQQARHDVYDPARSGKRLAGHTWRIMYGDSSGASGVVYADKVTVGPVTATSQAVEAATSISAQFVYDDANDGLLGLSFGMLNQIRPNKQKTFFDTVKANLTKPLFTATLKKGLPGTYDFGYIDTKKYTGELFYVPVDNAGGHWAFAVDGFSFGSGPMQTAKVQALADTGSSLWYVPSSVARAYYAQVPGARYVTSQAGYVIPCNAVLPDVGVSIGGRKVTVPGKMIQYARIGTLVGSNEPVCFGGIQPDTGMPFSVFGDVFLKALFVVFDHGSDGGRPRLGFAKQAGL